MTVHLIPISMIVQTIQNESCVVSNTPFSDRGTFNVMCTMVNQWSKRNHVSCGRLLFHDFVQDSSLFGGETISVTINFIWQKMSLCCPWLCSAINLAYIDWHDNWSIIPDRYDSILQKRKRTIFEVTRRYYLQQAHTFGRKLKAV